MSAPPPAPAPSADPPPPRPAPAPRPAPTPVPGPSTGPGNPGKARDILNNASRIDNFKTIPRLVCETILFSNDFITRLVVLAEFLIRQVWNQGANSIDPIAAGAAAANAQIAVLARNLIHHWFIDLYVGIRNSVQSLDPIIAQTNFVAELGNTGHGYPPFFSALYSMLMPTVSNRGTAEICYVPTWDFDLTRTHSNWFDIANMAANNVNARRFSALIDVFKRSKSVVITSLKVGTKHGSGSIFLDFWPLNNIDHANSWLYMDNNFNDMDLTVMYIIGLDIFADRLGPHFTFVPTHDQNTRDEQTTSYYAGFIENEDDVNAAGEYIDDSVNPHVVAHGNLYSRTTWAYTSRVLRNIDAYIQDQVMNIFNKA
jgi:hypothetical protein